MNKNKNMKYIKNPPIVYNNTVPTNDDEIIDIIDNIDNINDVNKYDISFTKSNEEKICIICIQGPFINIQNNNNNNNNNNTIEYVKFINTIEYINKSCECNYSVHDECFRDWLKEKLECPICHNLIIINDNNKIQLNNDDRNDMYINININENENENENEELLNRSNQTNNRNNDRKLVNKYIGIIFCIILCTYIVLIIQYYFF
jgi:hypothetical protein